jgi:hypothetical protein
MMPRKRKAEPAPEAPKPTNQPTSPSYEDGLNSLIGRSLSPFPAELAADFNVFLHTDTVDLLIAWVEAERQAARGIPPGRKDCPQCGRTLAECACTES